MKFKILILILAIFFLNFQIVAGAENKYGNVRAWFNGENATVNGVQLKIGEPIELKVDVLSKVNGHVTLKLKEPGVTTAYDVLSGPSKIDEKISNLNIESDWSKTYKWSLAPNGAWKNGNAPINIIVQFHDIKTKNDEIIQFTIANPCILDEQYTGAVTSLCLFWRHCLLSRADGADKLSYPEKLCHCCSGQSLILFPLAGFFRKITFTFKF